MKQWTRNKAFILSGLTVAVLAVYSVSYMNIIKPMKTEIGLMEQETQMFEKQYKKLQSQAVNNDEDSQLKAVSLQIPNQQALDTLMTNLQQAANATNVTITSITSTAIPESVMDRENSIHDNTFALDASAENLENMNAFLDSLLESERLLRIDMFDIYQSENEVDAAITFTAFYSP